MNKRERILRWHRYGHLHKQDIIDSINECTTTWLNYTNLNQRLRSPNCSLCNYTTHVVKEQLGVSNQEFKQYYITPCDFCILKIVNPVICIVIKHNLKEENFETTKRIVLDTSNDLITQLEQNDDLLKQYYKLVDDRAYMLFDEIDRDYLF